MTEPRQRPRFRVGPAVAVEEVPASDPDQLGRIYVSSLPDGPLLCLEGTAALIWTEALGVGEPSVAARVADVVGVSGDEVERDVAQFLDDLVQRGMLVEAGGVDPAGDRRAG